MKRNLIIGLLTFIMFSALGSTNVAALETSSQPPEFEEEVNVILSLIAPSMSDAEKALAVHEYFVLNYAYGYTHESNTAYGIMVNKKGLCNAYSEAYKYIMEKLEIPCIIVSSTAMNHAWNMVSIDGEWYHVDVTFDDTGKLGYGNHMNFLRSDKGIESTGHYGWVASVSAESIKYDNAFWITTVSYINYIEGYWYYVDSGDINLRHQDGFQIIDNSAVSDYGLIKKYSFEADTHKTIYKVSPQTYTYKRNGRSYKTKWKGSKASIAVYNGRIYYNTNNKIYSITPEGKNNNLVCTVELADFPVSSITGIAYIEGFEIKNGTISYKNSDDGETYVATTLPGATAAYTITASAGTGGQISPAVSIEVLKNRSRTYTITASDGFVISNVLIDGQSVGAVSKYVIKNVTANHSIHAMFDIGSSEWQVTIPDREYESINSFSEGLAVVEKDGKKGYIDTSGKLVIPLTNDYESLFAFNGGMGRVEKNGKIGCINTFGRLIVPCIYDFIGNFGEGMAAVNKGGKWGFMNTSGQLVIPCVYENIREFKNGVAWIFKNGEEIFVDTSGNVVAAPENKNDYLYLVQTGLTTICKGDKWGYVNADGKIIVPCIYDFIGEFSDGLAYVSQDWKYGYVNTSGELVVPCIYGSPGNFSDGLAYVSQNGKYGYINTSGELVVPCVYDDAKDFRDRLAPIKKDGQWALLKKTLPK